MSVLKAGPSVHFVMQAKGGVGKSTVAVLLAEYMIERELPLQCFDTDPSNATLYEFGGLNAEYVQSLKGFRVGESMFDPMMSKILKTKDKAMLVDVGTSNYLPMMSYLRDADLFSVLAEQERQVYVHVPIVGGADHAETMQGLEFMSGFVGGKGGRVVVWENDLRGVASCGITETIDGPGVCGIVPMRIGYDADGAMRGDTFLNDFRALMEHRLLFSELAGRDYFDDERKIEIHEVQRLRLNRLWAGIRSALNEVKWG
jgi:hypothetical protein